jgi:hypothetical protein
MKMAHDIHENISEKIFFIPEFKNKFQLELFRIERVAHFTPPPKKLSFRRGCRNTRKSL